MLLSEYIEKLQNVLTEHGDLEVVYSSDDEGNDFNKVYHDPTVGYYSSREFHEIDTFEYDEQEDHGDADYEDDFGYSISDINAVCIN